MIIKGKSRAGPQQLAKHLGNVEKNERVRVIESRGTVANDLRGALIEMDAYAVGTRCEKPLYHTAISPEPPHRLTEEQRAQAIDALEEKLGLTGHARVVVMHEKLGREHIHVVWSRIDLDRMVSVSDSHNYRKHEEVARELERKFGHDRVQGAHHEREGVERPERTPSRAEWQQQERTGLTGKMVKNEVMAAFRASDGPEAFRAALEQRGYMLARGDRRDHVIVDPLGGIHSLARRMDGMNAAQLRAYMAPLDKTSLPTIDEARAVARDRERRAREMLAAKHRDKSIEKAYARGEDYVSQTRAALKEHQKRQQRLQRQSASSRQKQSQKDGTSNSSAAEQRESVEPHDRERRQAREEISGRKDAKRRPSALSDKIEMTDAQRARIDRLLRNPDRDRDRDPDRQPQAPGGGRTRGR